MSDPKDATIHSELVVDPKVKEIRARLAAATPAPWRMTTQGGIEPGNYSGPGEDCTSVASTRNERDWVFIANAPTDIALLLTKLDEAARKRDSWHEHYNRLVDDGIEDGLRANAAEERERVLIAGVREMAELMSPEATLAATGFEDDGSRLTIEDVLKVTEHTVERTAKVRAILSRLLPSTPTEEGKTE